MDSFLRANRNLTRAAGRQKKIPRAARPHLFCAESQREDRKNALRFRRQGRKNAPNPTRDTKISHIARQRIVSLSDEPLKKIRIRW
jgi:hypothetical protein